MEKNRAARKIFPNKSFFFEGWSARNLISFSSFQAS
jgi:hypothetical protein